MFGLSAERINALCEALAQHANIQKAVIYGSRAKGNHRAGSDIDLTLYGDDIKPAQLHAVHLHLDDINFPYFVDLSVYTNITNENLKAHIQRAGKPFYERA